MILTVGTKIILGKLANISPKVTCWRLVHDGTNVIAFFESGGVTRTLHQMFVSTIEAEGETEISNLGLNPLPAEE